MKLKAKQITRTTRPILAFMVIVEMRDLRAELDAVVNAQRLQATTAIGLDLQQSPKRRADVCQFPPCDSPNVNRRLSGNILGLCLHPVRHADCAKGYRARSTLFWGARSPSPIREDSPSHARRPTCADLTKERHASGYRQTRKRAHRRVCEAPLRRTERGGGIRLPMPDKVRHAGLQSSASGRIGHADVGVR